MTPAITARIPGRSRHSLPTEPHDIREWLRCHTQEIRYDLTPRAPPGAGKRLKAWSDGLPAADRET